MGNILKSSDPKKSISEPPKSKPIEIIKCAICGTHKNINLLAGAVYVHKFSACGHVICRNCYKEHLTSIIENAKDELLDEVKIDCFDEKCKHVQHKEIKILLGDENFELYNEYVKFNSSLMVCNTYGGWCDNLVVIDNHF